jgi:DUF3012 family protein
MLIIKKFVPVGLAALLLLMLSACAAEIGSEQWCSDMKAKQKGDWTANEAMEFAKSCVLK